MNDDDPTTNDDGEAVPEPDGPITPEVVRGRRSGGFGGFGGGGASGARSRRETPTVRIAAAALAALGALLAFYGAGLVTSPDNAVCANARIIIKDHLAAAAADDGGGGGGGGTTTTTSGEPDSATTTTIGGIDPVAAAGIDSDEEADDRECPEVVAVATALDETDDDVQLPTDGLVRTLGTVILVTAAVQIIGGVLTLRRRSVGVRRFAIAGGVLGALTSLIVGIGIIGVVLYLAIIFGLVYSRDARATFGEPGGRLGGGARRRLAGGPTPGDVDGDVDDGGDSDDDGGGDQGGGPPRGGGRPRGGLPGGFAKPRK